MNSSTAVGSGIRKTKKQMANRCELSARTPSVARAAASSSSRKEKMASDNASLEITRADFPQTQYATSTARPQKPATTAPTIELRKTTRSVRRGATLNKYQ